MNSIDRSRRRLAVAAAAWALNVSPGLVRAAVESSASVLIES